MLPIKQKGAFYTNLYDFLKCVAAVGQVQQLVSGGQVLQILSAPPSSVPVTVNVPVMSGSNAQYTTSATSTVRPVTPAPRSKQPQLRPKPAASCPSPATLTPAVRSPINLLTIINMKTSQRNREKKELLHLLYRFQTKVLNLTLKKKKKF